MSFSRRLAATSVVVLLISVGVYLLSAGASTDDPEPVLPLSESSYVLEHNLRAYVDFMMSGGPPPDGIPAIDDPNFIDASSASLDPGDKVIGFVHEGDARAYPQRILVHHEIVNDEVGGFNVAITYCPLTATSQGFNRGETTLGVSGQLLNSNLVMFDRDSKSYFSQIAATGLTETHEGETLAEVNLIWTTWERWHNAHPNTKVLSENTGHMRNYSNDPYGRYNPIGGYYTAREVIFPLMHETDTHHPKAMVVGARTADASAHFILEDLKQERVQQVGDFVAVYDASYDTGYIYHTEDAPNITPVNDNRYEVEGEPYTPDALPLNGLVSVEAFFFAWHTFYPNSASV